MSDDNMSSKCSNYLEGLLTPDEKRDFERQLLEDPVFAKVFKDFKELFESEKILKSSTWKTPQGFESRLFSRIAAEKEHNPSSMFERICRAFEFLGTPIQVRVGIIATVFLLSFSVLLTQKLVTTTPQSVVLQETIESKRYDSVVESSPQIDAGLPETFSAFPEEHSVPADRIQKQDAALIPSIKPKPEKHQFQQNSEAVLRRKAEGLPKAPTSGRSQGENYSHSQPGSISEGALPESASGAGVPAARNLPLARSAPVAERDTLLASDGAQEGAFSQNNILSEKSSSTKDGECQSTYEILPLEAAQQVFDLPSKTGRVTHTTTTPARAIVCRKVNAWVGIRFLEDESCPWAPHAKVSSECQIGWVTLKDPR